MELKSSFNPWQYLTVFITAIIIDSIVHFFSNRKYTALKAGTDALGFAPELNIYYRSLAKKGPFEYTSGIDTWYNTFNSYIIGALIAGISCTLIVVIADSILYGLEYKNTN